MCDNNSINNLELYNETVLHVLHLQKKKKKTTFLICYQKGLFGARSLCYAGFLRSRINENDDYTSKLTLQVNYKIKYINMLFVLRNRSDQIHSSK